MCMRSERSYICLQFYIILASEQEEIYSEIPPSVKQTSQANKQLNPVENHFGDVKNSQPVVRTRERKKPEASPRRIKSQDSNESQEGSDVCFIGGDTDACPTNMIEVSRNHG